MTFREPFHDRRYIHIYCYRSPFDLNQPAQMRQVRRQLRLHLTNAGKDLCMAFFIWISLGWLLGIIIHIHAIFNRLYSSFIYIAKQGYQRPVFMKYNVNSISRFK